MRSFLIFVQIIIGFTLLISLQFCREQGNEPVYDPVRDTINVPQVTITENIFDFALLADSLSDTLFQSIPLFTDSVRVSVDIENFNGRRYSGGFQLLTKDSLSLYGKSISYDFADSSVYITFRPVTILALRCTDFSGRLQIRLQTFRTPDTLDPATIQPHDNALFYSSFEEDRPFAGFADTGYFRQSFEAAPGCGSRSLFIASSCVISAANYIFPPAERDGYYLMQCWGRTTSSGGVISFRVGLDRPGNLIFVRNTDTNWHFYQTTDTLFCPRDSVMSFRMTAGGISYSSMLIDALQVIEVAPANGKTN